MTATDAAALLPLQEALGYDLAQSLFAQQRNLVLEGLTDYWYLDATAQLLEDATEASLIDLTRRGKQPAEGGQGQQESSPRWRYSADTSFPQRILRE